jgi:hypothetical protein
MPSLLDSAAHPLRQEYTAAYESHEDGFGGETAARQERHEARHTGSTSQCLANLAAEWKIFRILF